MPPLRRAWLALLLAALLAAGTPAAALAQSKDDNGAVAVNTEDGSSQVDIAFDVRQVLDGVVDQTNLAVAVASCTECQTIAIAVQVVLVNSPVEVLAPKNIAYAINTECMTCLTVALAYQIVIGDAQKLRFTGEARRRLAEIAKAFRELERSDAPAQEILTEVNAIMHDLTDVLSTGLEPAGPLRGDDTARGKGEPSSDAEAAPDGTPEPGTTPTATPTPDATAAPEQSETPTATPTATPSPTATATPTATAIP